jgi:uncharacterized membrane protein YhaH (DUF805 family)
MEYFIDAFKQYAEFSGRATRKQYWMFILIYMVIYISLAVIDAVLGTLVLALIFSLVLAAPSISIAARRLHDTGRSGWWQLLLLIPLLGTIILIVFLAQDSEGDNEYGVKPEMV